MTGDEKRSEDAATTVHRVIMCEPRPDCADPHTYRWHCMRGHDGAAKGVCPLRVCERRGANRRGQS